MACHGLVLDLNKELNTAGLSSTCSFIQVIVLADCSGMFRVLVLTTDRLWQKEIELPMNTNESSHASPLPCACLHVRSSLTNILVAPTWSPHWLERSHRTAVACEWCDRVQQDGRQKLCNHFHCSADLRRSEGKTCGSEFFPQTLSKELRSKDNICFNFNSI